MSEPSFAALVLCKDSSSGYGGLNFLGSIRHLLDDTDGHGTGATVPLVAAAASWRVPEWMTKPMQQRLRVMVDTMWLMEQCVAFSEELRGVLDRPSRRARLSSLLQAHAPAPHPPAPPPA